MLAWVLLLTAAPSDEWLTLQAQKLALATSTSVSADVADGQVALSGVLASDEARRDLHAKLLRIPRVTKVISFIEVLPLADRRAPNKAELDDEARAALSALTTPAANAKTSDAAKARGDGALANGGREVSVVAVNEGHVVVAGRVRDAAEELRVLRRVARVDGVRSVESRMHIATPGAVVRDDDDAELVRRTKLALAADPRLLSALYVDAVNGSVTVFGYVSDDAQRRIISDLGWRVPGVMRFRALLVTDAAQAGSASAPTDAQIKADVTRLLANKSIGVEVADGIVTLRGEMTSSKEAVDATLASRRLPGVRAVVRPSM